MAEDSGSVCSMLNKSTSTGTSNTNKNNWFSAKTFCLLTCTQLHNLHTKQSVQ